MANRSGMTYSEAGKLGAIKFKENLIKRQQTLVDEYNKHPNYCKVCGNILSYEKRFNKCCCRSCATTLGNNGRVLTDETKKKIANSNTKKHIKICKYCGQPIDSLHNHEICKKHQIFKSLVKFGFDLTTIGTIKLFNEYNRVKEIIENFYIEHSSDSKLLKQLYDYTSGSANFHKLLKSLNIKCRNSKNANLKSYIDGKLGNYEIITKYQSAWHTTWNGKEVYLRSSYEADYANELDKKQINYEVECFHIKYFDTQKQEYRCAIPDFYLPDTNTIVEIKSNYTLDVQNMKDKAAEYKKLGYNFSLILEHIETNLYSL